MHTNQNNEFTYLGIEEGYTDAFDSFWKYFVKTWTKQYDVKSWNLHHLLNNPTAINELRQRTNNCLERYNREMNNAFKTAHPNLITFVDIIKGKSLEFVERIKRVANNEERAPVHNTHIVIPPIPQAYIDFEI